jgi:catechol 2,3-dioxygenase-like lactoylglutathione lyase family enzyme
MTIGVRHTGIVVQDLDGAIRFWTTLMGLEVVSNQLETGSFIDLLLGIDNVSVQTVKLRAVDKTMVELLKFGNKGCESDPEKKPNSSGITHIAFTVKNIEEILLKLRENSYFPINHAQLSDEGHVKVCYLVGFEGILIELVEEVRL